MTTGTMTYVIPEMIRIKYNSNERTMDTKDKGDHRSSYDIMSHGNGIIRNHQTAAIVFRHLPKRHGNPASADRLHLVTSIIMLTFDQEAHQKIQNAHHLLYLNASEIGNSHHQC
jgi:hypothetical protein